MTLVFISNDLPVHVTFVLTCNTNECLFGVRTVVYYQHTCMYLHIYEGSW